MGGKNDYKVTLAFFGAISAVTGIYLRVGSLSYGLLEVAEFINESYFLYTVLYIYVLSHRIRVSRSHRSYPSRRDFRF